MNNNQTLNKQYAVKAQTNKHKGKRANTTAKKMADAVPIHIRRERSRQLQILSEKKKRAFYESQLGTQHEALFESEDHSGFLHGFTENYVKVKVPFDPSLINQTVKVKLETIDSDGLVPAQLLEEVIVG